MMITSTTVPHDATDISAETESASGGFLPSPFAIRGVRVVPFGSPKQAVRCLEQRITQRLKTFCVAVNPEKIFRAGKNPELRRILHQADVGLCDGIGIVMGARILYGRKVTRCAGCDLFFHLLERSAQTGWRVFLLGASSESSMKAVGRLGELFPNLQLAGYHDGYFEDSGEMVRKINHARTDLLFVALGSPRQEFWIAENLRSIDAPFCMGVGGSIDVLSGKATRAPSLFRKTGTEFLFRLMADPRRWKRQIALPGFMLQVLADKLFGSRKVG